MNTVSMFDEASFHCSARMTAQYSTSFYSAIRWLHPDLRAGIHGIYGFVRLCDEIVDTFHVHDKKMLLDQVEQETYSAIAKKISLNPILQSFQLTVNRYGIDLQLIAAFLGSMRTDLDKRQWESPAELKEYIYGSAEVVGLMCLQVFCEGDRELVKKLTPSATALGSAFQKVNFLRDLRDDVEGLNRQYFPGVDLKRFTAADKEMIEADILKDFREAREGILLLPAKARFAVQVAYRYYFCLFRKIRSVPPEVLKVRRVRVPNFQKMLLLMQTSLMNRWQFV